MNKTHRPFPLRFKLKGASWRVRFKKGLKEDGEPCSGLTDPDERIIHISADLTGANLEWVFWHEYCHAILYESGVTKNTGGIGDLAEEIICDNFADAMMRVKQVTWKQNKKS